MVPIFKRLLGSAPLCGVVCFLTYPSMVVSAEEPKQYEVGVAYILTKPDVKMCGYYQNDNGEEVPELSKIIRRKDTSVIKYSDGRTIRGNVKMTDSERTCCVKGRCSYPKENLFIK
ncbi:hypothetical protein GUA87_06940 [Sneathiella sp. P13V-1]|uniref:hypothetical protein n=1 Tax=Sneathiella sp. P13V-1 TaxID=2697366 RepID=UPI00187BC451|nr:hypothetical protein [Sneathiella sp. P13V-1]MBE7636576.1 hypothetical protein [Sneathiella sp. P13V-1]